MEELVSLNKNRFSQLGRVHTLKYIKHVSICLWLVDRPGWCSR